MLSMMGRKNKITFLCMIFCLQTIAQQSNQQHDDSYYNPQISPSPTIPSYKEHQKPNHNPALDIKFSSTPNYSPASDKPPPTTSDFETHFQPETFDWEATHADRYVHSPCYSELGFMPTTDPVLMKQQEERYQQCESEKKTETIKKFSIIAIVIAVFISIIYFAIKNTKSISN
jgi:hypothetical protein